jgi:hypothetical protein
MPGLQYRRQREPHVLKGPALDLKPLFNPAEAGKFDQARGGYADLIPTFTSGKPTYRYK